MIWMTLFYYLIIFITLYLWWLIFFRSYYTKDCDNFEGTWNKGDKVKFSLWKLVVTFPAIFVPGLNIILLLWEISFMIHLSIDYDVVFRSFLFKKI